MSEQVKRKTRPQSPYLLLKVDDSNKKSTVQIGDCYPSMDAARSVRDQHATTSGGDYMIVRVRERKVGVPHPGVRWN